MSARATTKAKRRAAVATHRPAVRKRRFRHDSLIAGDFFSGFGGLTEGIEEAGFDVIVAANHDTYKVAVHEANYSHVEHWIANLVDPDSADYHSARDLPPVDLLTAGVSCTNHSQANTEKAYAEGLTLFGMDDPDYEERVTKSEQDRATANCVLHYAQTHHPRLILVECTTELQSWGPAVPGKKYGDGTTFRWWLRQFNGLDYKHRIMYLNSMFFGVPQSRDRLFIAFWDRRLPAPDLDHRPPAHCRRCDQVVEAVWTWRTGIPPTGSVRYGKQYEYRCPRCRRPVVPPMTPSLAALDLSDLGTRIGDRARPLVASTMARARRCLERFAEFPAVLMPAKGVHGSERHPLQPLATQTSQQETALLSTGAVIPGHRHNGDGQHIGRPMDTVTTTHEKALLLAVDNYQGAARGTDEPLPTQVGSETLGMLSTGVLPYRKNTLPTVHSEAMPTVTSDQIPALLTAAGWYKQNGSTGSETAPHPLSDPLGTLTARDTTALLTAQWRALLADLNIEDCHYRMLGPHEIGRGCGFDVDFASHKGAFIVWGPARDQVDGFGNAVSPAVGTWIGKRLRATIHGPGAAS